MKHIFYLLFFAVLLLAACSDNEERQPLSFGEAYTEIRLSRYTQDISFEGGSGVYSVFVEDGEVLEAYVDEQTLKLSAKKKGETAVSVRDDESQEEATIRIKVVDNYMGFVVGSSVPENDLYVSGDHLFLVGDHAHSFYLYDASWNEKMRGTHQFLMEESGLFLSLLPEGEEDALLYDVTSSNLGLIQVILEWLPEYFPAAEKGMTRSVSPVIMNALETETGNKFSFWLDTGKMPYHVLM